MPDRFAPHAQAPGYLLCPGDVRDAVRGRLREDSSFTDWCDLLDELEADGDAMRQAVRDSLERVPLILAPTERRM
jgi:hypothetical protein